jgi:hypothetical protein
MPDLQYEHGVFVNCPFDDEYRPLFEAVVFTLHDCGYVAHSALEVTDASQVRIEKIGTLIAGCKLGLHDISRTELDAITGLPRFNMPLELGLFLGAKRFGAGKQKQKNCLILDVDRYRYQKFISDIAGQDIVSHGGEPAQAIRIVRDWLSDAEPKSLRMPAGTLIRQRYEQFRNELPEMCTRNHLFAKELTFNEYVLLVEEWLDLQARIPS